MTSVEKAATQANFIRKVASELKAGDSHTLVRGDVFKFIASCRHPFDIVFADPPYDLEGFVKEVVEWQNEQPSLKSVLDTILQMAIEYVEE